MRTPSPISPRLPRPAGVPFRETHHISGAAVKLAEDRGCELSDLTVADLQGIHPLFGEDVTEVGGPCGWSGEWGGWGQWGGWGGPHGSASKHSARARNPRGGEGGLCGEGWVAPTRGGKGERPALCFACLLSLLLGGEGNRLHARMAAVQKHAPVCRRPRCRVFRQDAQLVYVRTT